MEQVYDRERLQKAWQQIRRNAGAAGIDEITVREFEEQEQRYLNLAAYKLRTGIYRFRPARRVPIRK
jgi:retron-type reverse transcriptase